MKYELEKKEVASPNVGISFPFNFSVVSLQFLFFFVAFHRAFHENE